MSAEPFNSIGGFSSGIPPVLIVDNTGNVVTNINAPNANITANRVFANTYLFANGQPFVTSAGGSNTQLQFNNNGLFGGIPNVTWNGNVLSLGNVSKVKILGGVNGYFLQTDGTGNLSWANGGGGGGGNGSPGGANSQVQFNDAGTFGGDAGFTYDNVNNLLTVGDISTGNISANYITLNWDVTANVVYSNYLYGDGSNITNVAALTSITAGTVTTNAQPNITSVGTLTSLAVTGTTTGGNFYANSGTIGGNLVAGTLTTGAQPNIISVGVLTALSVSGNIVSGNIYANSGTVGASTLTGTLTTAAQPNITSLGTLSSLTTTGNIQSSLNIIGANVTAGQFLSGANAVISGTANISGAVTIANTGSLTSTGNVNFNGSSNINLGTLANIHIAGGVNGYVISTDGAGNLSWTAGGGGGNGIPGGSNTQIQFNDTGSFAGSPYYTFNKITNTVTVAGNLVANTFTMGAGVYNFSHANVFFATTNSSTPNQVLLAIEAADVAGVDYTIISTDGVIRNLIKISAVRSGSTVNYVEYSTIPVNGYTGDFSVVYDPGGVITPATIQLKFTPQNSNLMTHKMMVTTYEE